MVTMLFFFLNQEPIFFKYLEMFFVMPEFTGLPQRDGCPNRAVLPQRRPVKVSPATRLFRRYLVAFWITIMNYDFKDTSHM